MKYTKKFEKHAYYLAYAAGFNDTNTPNVSKCVQEGEIHCTPYIPPHDYSQDYLTFTALESGTISFNIWKSMGTNMITSISYSTDNGSTWTTTNNVDNKEEHLQISVNVNANDKVLWKGIAQQLGYYDEDDYYDGVGSFFSSDCEFIAEGNIMSMLYGDNFIGEDTIEEDYVFAFIFSDYDGEQTCSIVDASNMVLHVTTLTSYCYYGMFYGCTSLTTAPTLPATTLADFCYYQMFQVCTSLTTAPELPATTLAEGCYDEMFYGCSSLTIAPTLPATTLADLCYSDMFYNCTALTTAPELPVTTLTSNCYNSMFYGCTSLTTAPELPATTLANYCYQNMFQGCTALTTAPELPATTLATYCYSGMFFGCSSLTTAPTLSATTLTNNCYYQMFQGCTALTTAPELPATTLTNGCYSNMFYGCTSLNYIKCLATDIYASSCTYDWLSYVASSGTFVKNANMASWTTGTHGIPSGWTIQNAA